MAIDREQVLHVARLARLDLTDAEVERLTGELGAILDAVSKVAELDLADVPPTSHPLDLVNAWAEDEPHASLALEDVLSNAPASDRAKVWAVWTPAGRRRPPLRPGASRACPWWIWA